MEDQATKQAAIEEINRRLIDYYHPVRIGLLRRPAGRSPEPVRPAIHRALWGVGTAADVVRYPLSDFEGRAAHVVSPLPAAVVREGRLLYEHGNAGVPVGSTKARAEESVI